jgi:hypothetical protein
MRGKKLKKSNGVEKRRRSKRQRKLMSGKGRTKSVRLGKKKIEHSGGEKMEYKFIFFTILSMKWHIYTHYHFR